MGIFFFLMRTAALWTYLKLSWMLLDQTNAFWFLFTSSSSFGANRSARILETSFAKLWMMVIGLKSLGHDAPILFGSSTTTAFFRPPSPLKSP